MWNILSHTSPHNISPVQLGISIHQLDTNIGTEGVVQIFNSVWIIRVIKDNTGFCFISNYHHKVQKRNKSSPLSGILSGIKWKQELLCYYLSLCLSGQKAWASETNQPIYKYVYWFYYLSLYCKLFLSPVGILQERRLGVSSDLTGQLLGCWQALIRSSEVNLRQSGTGYRGDSGKPEWRPKSWMTDRSRIAVQAPGVQSEQGRRDNSVSVPQKRLMQYVPIIGNKNLINLTHTHAHTQRISEVRRE